MDWQYFINFRNKKFLTDAALVYFGALINGASLFLISAALGRFLNQELFAIFSLSVLALSTLAEMSDFGLNGGLLRFAPYYLNRREDDKLKQLVKVIWRWRVWLSFILTAGGIILSYPIAKYGLGQPQLSGYLAFSFLGVGGVVLLGFVSAYLQASRRFVYNSALQALKGVLRLIIIITMVIIGVNNIYAYLSVYLLVPWLLLFISYHKLPERFMSVSLPEDDKKRLNSQLAKFSFWLAIWSWSAIIASRIDQIMLSNLMGLAQVAVYSVAFQFVYFYSLVSQSVSAVLTPRISAIGNKADIMRTMKWLSPLIIITAIFIYPSQYILTIFFGHKYDASLPVYLILSFSMLVSYISIPFSLSLSVFNKTNLLAISGVLQFIVNVAVNFWLIPIFGVIGAAMTFAVGSMVSLIYTVVCLKYLMLRSEIKIA